MSAITERKPLRPLPPSSRKSETGGAGTASIQTPAFPFRVNRLIADRGNCPPQREKNAIDGRPADFRLPTQELQRRVSKFRPSPPARDAGNEICKKSRQLRIPRLSGGSPKLANETRLESAHPADERKSKTESIRRRSRREPQRQEHLPNGPRNWSDRAPGISAFEKGEMIAAEARADFPISNSI